MQLKKIILVLAVCFSIAAAILYMVPIEREYNADIDINSTNIITYRTLLDTTNWSKWYATRKVAALQPHGIQLSRDKSYKQLSYAFAASENVTREGQVKVIKSNRWNTKISWVEKITLEKGFRAKLRLIFHSADYRDVFLQNVVQFKNYVEHPEDTYGGLTFRRRNIPANKLITISDTIAFAKIETQLPGLYTQLAGQVKPAQLKQNGQYFSQHEMLNDSTAMVRVGTIVTDEVLSVKAPYDLLEMDEYQAIVMQINNNYAEINEDISVMYDWLKKNDSRPAAGFWIEHNEQKSLAQNNPAQSLTVIQQFYLLK